MLKILLIFAMLLFSVGLITMLARRMAIGMLIGQMICLKAVLFIAMAAAAHSSRQSDDFMSLAMAAVSVSFIAVAIGFGVMLRAQRFDGALDSNKENRLRN